MTNPTTKQTQKAPTARNGNPSTDETKQTNEQTQTMTQQQARDALRAAGFKKCPSHERLLDRLPDEAKVMGEGQTDISIRPLDQFQKNTSACRYCDHILQKDWRATHKSGTTLSTREAKQRKVERLTAQYNALAEQINRLETELRQESEQQK